MEKHPSKSLLAIMVMSGCDFLCLTACRCQTQTISRTVLWGIWRGAYRLWKETKLARRQKPEKIICREFAHFHSLKRLWSTLLVLPQVVCVNCKRVFVLTSSEGPSEALINSLKHQLLNALAIRACVCVCLACLSRCLALKGSLGEKGFLVSCYLDRIQLVA